MSERRAEYDAGDQVPRLVETQELKLERIMVTPGSRWLSFVGGYDPVEDCIVVKVDPAGDEVHHYLRSQATVDTHLTLLYDSDTFEILGVKIEGVAGLLAPDL